MAEKVKSGAGAWKRVMGAVRRGEEGLGGIVRAALRSSRYRWWHALAFGVAANLAGRAGGIEDRRWYEEQRQASFAPPGWVFAPAWAINNASVLWGNLRLLNLPEDTPHRRRLLWLQGVSWALYSSFGYVYFGKRSPILAFVWTTSFYVLTIVSAALGWRVDRKIALSFVTLLLWLTLATPVAAYQMVHNPDEYFRTPAWRR